MQATMAASRPKIVVHDVAAESPDTVAASEALACKGAVLSAGGGAFRLSSNRVTRSGKISQKCLADGN